jgi:4-amino-4-deoxychorismate lyase
MSTHGEPHRSAGADPELVLINGQAGSMSPLDRGLHFGDGVFETIACRDGRARFLALHLERLASGCERLKIPIRDLGAIREEVTRAVSGLESALIKLIVTRGPAAQRGYAWSGRETATRVLLRYRWPQEDTSAWTRGVRVRVAAMRLGENPALAGMKHLNRLEQVLARAEVPVTEAAELLLFGTSGRLVSGAMSNVFMVREGRLLTPRLDSCGVAGVMRRVVIREAARAGVVAEEGDLYERDLQSASEVFLTNARIGIWPVAMLDARALGPGPVTQQLQTLISPLLESPADA